MAEGSTGRLKLSLSGGLLIEEVNRTCFWRVLWLLLTGLTNAGVIDRVYTLYIL